MMREFVFPMKAEEAEGDARAHLGRLEAEGGWVGEAKLDGHRAQVIVRDGSLVGFTHDGHGTLAGRFPEVAARLAAAVPERGLWVVDGELGPVDAALLKMNFTAVQSRSMMNDGMRIDFNSRRCPMTFVAFDILHAGDQDARALPYDARRALLVENIQPNGNVRVVDATPRLVEHYDLVCGVGGEGVMAKLRSAPYAGGKRSASWCKAKAPRFMDNLHVVGLLAGEGKRSTTLGSLVLARRAPDGKLDYVCKAGTGLSAQDLVRIVDHVQARRVEACPLRERPPYFDRELLMWVEPCLRVDIEFDPPIPAKDGKPPVPRHPRVKNVHYD